jgi:hypothetical protein
MTNSNNNLQQAQHVTKLHVSVQFKFDTGWCTSLDHYSLLLREKLRRKKQKTWTGKVFMHNPNTGYTIYDVFRQRTISTLSGVAYGTFNKTSQLQDGSIFIGAGRQVFIFAMDGEILHKVELKSSYQDHLGPLELPSGKLLFTTAQQTMSDYNRKTNIANEVEKLDKRNYFRSALLHDGRIVCMRLNNEIDIRDSEYNLIKMIPNTRWVFMAKEYKPNLLLCAGEKEAFTLDIESEQTGDFFTTGTEALENIIFLENNVIALAHYEKLVFLKDFKVIGSVEGKQGSTDMQQELFPGVLGYAMENGCFYTYDTNTNKIEKYALPTEECEFLNFLFE